MQLRRWQAACAQHALSKYAKGYDRFLCLASPGAGKTVMASYVTDQLFQKEAIDLVLCFSPSVLIARGFQATLATITGKRMDGGLASVGRSLTYQQLLSLKSDFWQLFEDYRVFVIFDEVHHCGGSDETNATAWGSQILMHIHQRARYILSLSGTPWRTDNIPVVLGDYDDTGIVCDYVYGLADAIHDRVCREPHLVAVDNSGYQLTDDEGTTQFTNLAALLGDHRIQYQAILNHDAMVKQVLKRAIKQLDRLQKQDASAAGLVVASSVEHAYWIQSLFTQYFNTKPAVVSHLDNQASERIEAFRHNSEGWIISVGMISEGTDIPRLQVCCHLSFVKTELYFRQILGRVLRVTAHNSTQGFLFFPAEPLLLTYAKRLIEDIPAGRSSLDVVVGTPEIELLLTEQSATTDHADHHEEGGGSQYAPTPNRLSDALTIVSEKEPKSVLSGLPPRLEMFGRFRQEVIRLYAPSEVF